MPDELAARKIADRFAPRFRELFLAVIAQIAAGPSLGLLETAIDNGDIAEVMRLWETHLAESTVFSMEVVSELFEEALEAVGKKTLSTVPVIAMTFDRMSENALTWITHHSMYLVSGINADAHQSLRILLETGYRQGMGARWTARQMREVVGLLPSHTQALSRYIENLRERRFPPNVITTNANAYARRLLTYRTENIARTETITASTAGQMAAWTAMIQSGVLQNHRTWVEWMVTEDDRLCPLCAPMDGQRVRVGELFASEYSGFREGTPRPEGPGSRRLARRGPLRPDPLSQPRDKRGRFMVTKALTELKNSVRVPYPPLHPSCRCALVLRFDQ